MSKLKTRYSTAIEAAIAKAKASRDLVTVPAFDGAEAYAYPKPGNRIGWGVNAAGSGFNVVRGVRRPDGSDEAVGAKY